MWPQLLRCGNLPFDNCQNPNLDCFNVAATFALRKSGIIHGIGRPQKRLQCGRNFCVAEIGNKAFSTEMGREASMWPQLLRCGNQKILRQLRETRLASMWPQLLRCGNTDHKQ